MIRYLNKWKGKLYINYPMIESYLHLKAIPDVNYEESNILVSLQPGKKYKNLVKKETVIYKDIDFIHRLHDLLNEHFGITDDSIRDNCIKNILNISNSEGLEDKIHSIFQNIISTKDLQTLKYQLIDWINNIGYVNDNKTYWLYMRKLFNDIIYHNIAKANRIQNGVYSIEYNKCKDYFSRLDHVEILKMQNQYSTDKSNGIIWILNTCVFIVPDYNFDLLKAGI